MEDTFAHYGVLGMKWGVRKDRESTGRKSKKSKSYGKTRSGYELVISEDASPFAKIDSKQNVKIRETLSVKTPKSALSTGARVAGLKEISKPIWMDGETASYSEDFGNYHEAGVRSFKKFVESNKNSMKNKSDKDLLNFIANEILNQTSNGSKIDYGYQVANEAMGYSGISLNDLLEISEEEPWQTYVAKALSGKLGDDEKERVRKLLEQMGSVFEALHEIPNWNWLNITEQNKQTESRYATMVDAVNTMGLSKHVIPMSIPSENGMMNLYIVQNPKTGQMVRADEDQFDLVLDYMTKWKIPLGNDPRNSRSRETNVDSSSPATVKKRQKIDVSEEERRSKTAYSMKNQQEQAANRNKLMERLSRRKNKTTSSGRNDMAQSEEFMESEKVLQHYGIIGMKWGVRRTPEQLGHAPKSERKAFRKQVRADEKEYRKLRREVTAAQRNVRDRSKQDDISKELVIDAEKNYKEAISRREPFFNSRKKADRRLAITAAEQELNKRLEASERSEGKRRQALRNAEKAINRMDSFLQEMNEKYGAENVRQLNRNDVTTGALWWKQVRMEDGFKTPVNMASAPLIGRTVSARIINQMEREDRQQLMDERLSDYNRKKYA